MIALVSHLSMRIFFLVFSTLFLVHCATKPLPKDSPSPAVPPSSIPSGPPSILIDYEGLQASLKLIRSRETLGYLEKSFETCKAGYGYPSNQNCRRDYFVLVHFKLLCRDADESSHTAFDASRMEPLSHREIRWSMRDRSGTLTLDDQGFGQILTTSPVSLKSQRLKISADNENLHIRASDLGRIVAPPVWCSK